MRPSSSALSTGEQPDIPDSSADVVERLLTEFADRYALTDITDMVRECRMQLSCSPVTALPELIERLARQRLSARHDGSL